MPDVKVLAFDTGGTILDWHSGIVAVLRDCGVRRGVARDWHERRSPGCSAATAERRFRTLPLPGAERACHRERLLSDTHSSHQAAAVGARADARGRGKTRQVA